MATTQEHDMLLRKRLADYLSIYSLDCTAYYDMDNLFGDEPTYIAVFTHRWNRAAVKAKLRASKLRWQVVPHHSSVFAVDPKSLEALS